MSPGFAAAVLEGFVGTLDELLDRDLSSDAQAVLTNLREQIVAGIDALMRLAGEPELSSGGQEVRVS
jgi:hypothetical protein